MQTHGQGQEEEGEGEEAEAPSVSPASFLLLLPHNLSFPRIKSDASYTKGQNWKEAQAFTLLCHFYCVLPIKTSCTACPASRD